MYSQAGPNRSADGAETLALSLVPCQSGRRLDARKGRDPPNHNRFSFPEDTDALLDRSTDPMGGDRVYVKTGGPL